MRELGSHQSVKQEPKKVKRNGKRQTGGSGGAITANSQQTPTGVGQLRPALQKISRKTKIMFVLGKLLCYTNQARELIH